MTSLSRVLQRGSVRPLLLLILMKVANQFASFNYLLFNANIYETVNGTCQMKPRSEADKASTINDPVMAVMYRYSYAIAAVGGLLSSASSNRRLILTVGGWIMAGGSAAVGAVRALGLACSRAAYTLAWLPHPAYMALVLACLLAGFADTATGGRPSRRTVALLLYYLAASSTIWLNMGLWSLVDCYRYHRSHELVAAAATGFGLAFVVAARLLPAPPRRQPPFELPTKRRLLRYFLILTAFTLFIVQLDDGHIVVYQLEALHYMDVNSSAPGAQAIVDAFRAWNVPRTVNIGGMLAGGICLACLSGCSSFQTRLLSGIGLSAAAAVSSFACDLALRASGPAAPALPAVAFSVVACVEGATEVVTMVAAYEFVDAIAPRSHKDLLFGIALSVWSTAGVLRRALFGALLPLLVPPPLARDAHAQFCIKHAVDFALAIACLAYTRIVSLPLADTLLQSTEPTPPLLTAEVDDDDDKDDREDGVEEDPISELDPLLPTAECHSGSSMRRA